MEGLMPTQAKFDEPLEFLLSLRDPRFSRKCQTDQKFQNKVLAPKFEDVVDQELIYLSRYGEDTIKIAESLRCRFVFDFEEIWKPRVLRIADQLTGGRLTRIEPLIVATVQHYLECGPSPECLPDRSNATKWQYARWFTSRFDTDQQTQAYVELLKCAEEVAKRELKDRSEALNLAAETLIRLLQNDAINPDDPAGYVAVSVRNAAKRYLNCQRTEPVSLVGQSSDGSTLITHEPQLNPELEGVPTFEFTIENCRHAIARMPTEIGILFKARKVHGLKPEYGAQVVLYLENSDKLMQCPSERYREAIAKFDALIQENPKE
ncbi:MAG: hypothetical protein U0930_16485 [Pirellulales bacterium]